MIQLLFRGPAAAMKGRELAALLNVTEREVVHIVSTARRDGAPIVSGKEGYYIARDERELESFTRRLWRRGWEIRTTACSLAVAAKDGIVREGGYDNYLDTLQKR